MGQKIATEEDYWMCTQGIMPARMQSVQLTVKQKDGKKYLLKTDTATASVGDFVCKWMMLIMAAIAAIVTVAIVATGGAALGAIVVAGAIAGAAGAAVGSIAGALVCGQKAALIRTWTVEKNNLVIGGQKTLTTGSVMKCPIFGAEIRQAPNVKNWWQALLVGVGNFGTTVVEGALGGALIGTIGAVFAGAATIAVPTLGSIWANIAGSFTGIGLAVRGVFGANQASNDWATGRANTASDAAQSFGEGAIPEAGSIKRIATGQAQPTDALLLLYFLHLKTPVKEPQPKEEPAKEDEGKTKDEPDAQAPKPANEPEAVKPGEDGKAYEEGISTKVKGDLGEARVIEDLKAKGFTEVVQVQNNSGHGVDVIARNPLTGDVKCIEVKANSSKLSADQQLGGKEYVKNRLDRATSNKGHYKIPPNSEQMRADALKAKEWIRDADNVDYEVHQVPVDNATGVTGTPKISPWDPKPVKVPATNN